MQHCSSSDERCTFGRQFLHPELQLHLSLVESIHLHVRTAFLPRMEPTFSLIYTSVRPQAMTAMVREWMAKAANPQAVEVIVAVDAGDEAALAAAKALSAEFPLTCLVQESAPFNCVKGWNLAATKATGKVLVQLTDDIFPPKHWDLKLLSLEPGDWMNQDCAVHVEDGYVHNIMVIAIVTKVRYSRFGYLFYPGYESLFCDTELTELAYRENRVIQAKHLLFEHKHPDCNKRARDDVDKVHASPERWQRGEALFHLRRANSFPVDLGPMARSEQAVRAIEEPASIATKSTDLRFCAYIQATRDDLCLLEVCARLAEEGVRDFVFSIPNEYWSGRPVSEEEGSQVRGVADELKKRGLTVNCLLHEVKTYRWPGDTRIQVETRVRNDALDYVRKLGFEHILVVDGDELWKHGTLNYIKEVINRWHPSAINCLMIPVVGCPGYPIDGATDVAVVYIHASTAFKECRSPITEQFRIQMPLVMHFTGTRRTMEETIRKHTDSGHFDDPDYLFAEWIEKVLPNIKPGFTHTWPNGLKGVHMYQKYQIWRAVRDWTADEITEIPKSVWPFLGGLRQLQCLAQEPVGNAS